MANYRDIGKMLDIVISYTKGVIRDAERLKVDIDNGQDPYENLSKVITGSEKAALLSRKLSAVKKVNSEVITELDILENMDLPPYTSLYYDDRYEGYIMILPPLNGKRHALRRHGDTGWIRSIAMALIKQYEGDVKVFEEPLLIFEHHIDVNDNLMRYMDADNIDTKRITDTLQGTFLKDDNALYLSVMHVGVLDNQSFCKLHIIPKNSLEKWAKTRKNDCKI